MPTRLMYLLIQFNINDYVTHNKINIYRIILIYFLSYNLFIDAII